MRRPPTRSADEKEMTRNSGRNLPKQLTSLHHSKHKQYEEDAGAKSMITSMTKTISENQTDLQRRLQQHNHNSKPNNETLELGRRRRFRYFVASLGLTVAAVNCYAQATFCIAIVEMVLPPDYVFKGESGSPSMVKVVPSHLLGNSTIGGHLNLSVPNERPIEELESQSCPVEYKYRDYYDEWRFPNVTSSSSASDSAGLSSPASLANLLLSAKAAAAPASSSQHVLDVSNRFDWDASRQGLLLGAFAMGMAPLQVLGGRLAEIYGAKWVLLAGCIGTALTNLTIPLLAHFSYTLLVVNRVVMGIAQAGMEPGLMCLMAQWLAPAETGFFISMLLFALCIGFFLGSLLSSFLLTIGLGWAITYYVTGALNVVVSLVWLFYASKGPDESGLISAEELAYIKHEQQQERAKAMKQHQQQPESINSSSVVNNDLAHQDGKLDIAGRQTGSGSDQHQGQAPWMNILSTRSVWAFIICKISVRWCADVLTIELPTYLANVLHLSIKLNGILNSLSSAFFAIFSFITGYFVNELLKRTHEGAANEQERENLNNQNSHLQHHQRQHRQLRRSIMSKTTLRKLFQSVASFGSAVAIFLMTHYDCNIQLSMSMMFVLSACLMMGTGGELQIPYDMTSRYPGTLHGMACTLSVSGWLAPPLIGLILGDQPSSRHRWSIVWYLTASINFIGGLVFVLFADASPRNFDAASQVRGASKKRPPLFHPPTWDEKQRSPEHRQHHHHHQNGNLSASASRRTSAADNGQQQDTALLATRSTCATNPARRSRPAQQHKEQEAARGKGYALAMGAAPEKTATEVPAPPFDGGELLKIRQLEGSLLSSSSRLDSLLAARLTDVMFPYQQERKQPPTAAAAAGQTTNGLSEDSPLFRATSWLPSVGTTEERSRQQNRKQHQRTNGSAHLLQLSDTQTESSLPPAPMLADFDGRRQSAERRSEKIITRL